MPVRDSPVKSARLIKGAKEVYHLPVRFQPMAAEAVASAVGRVAVGAPLNGVVEVESSLLPGDDARLGKTTLRTWLDRAAVRSAAA